MFSLSDDGFGLPDFSFFTGERFPVLTCNDNEILADEREVIRLCPRNFLTDYLGKRTMIAFDLSRNVLSTNKRRPEENESIGRTRDIRGIPLFGV